MHSDDVTESGLNQVTSMKSGPVNGAVSSNKSQEVKSIRLK